MDNQELPDLDFSNIDAAEEVGVEPASIDILPSDIDEINQIHAETKKYEDRPIAAGSLAALDAASFSLGGRFLDKTGLLSSEEQAKIAEYNPGADTAGTLAGIVAPAILTLGASAPVSAAEAGVAATRAGLSATAKGAAKVISAPSMAVMKGANIAEKALEGALKSSGNKILAREVVKKSIAKGVASGMEGAAFGVGQLAREDALGTRDFNAENLLDAAGTGAIYGGIIGSAIPVLGASMKGVGKTGKYLFDKAAVKYGDAVADAQKITGLTPSEVVKMERSGSGKALLEDLPRFYKEEAKWGLADDAETRVMKVEKVKENAANDLEYLYDKIDSAAKQRVDFGDIQAAEMRPKLFWNIADKLEEEFIAPNKNLTGMKSKLRPVRTLIADLRKMAYDAQRGISATELRSVRMEIDRLGKELNALTPWGKSNAAIEGVQRARNLFRDAINTYADYISPELGSQLKKANRNYFTAETILPHLQKQTLKGENLGNWRDLLIGTIGYNLGGNVGLATAGVKKFLESDLKRKIVILNGIEKGNLSVNKKIVDAAENFVSGTKKVTAPLRPSVLLMGSQLGHKQEDGKKPQAPKNKQEAFKNVSENLTKLATDTLHFEERIAKTVGPISYAAPETALAVTETMQKAIQYLVKKMPKSMNTVDVAGLSREYQPSTQELSKFERILRTVENPTSVLDDLQNGTLTREQVDAIREVYPNLYSRIRTQVLEQVKKDGDKLTYSKRIQLGMLLDIQTDPSLRPSSILALQHTYAQEQEQEQGAVKPTAGAAKEINVAERSASANQAFAARRAQE
jgi:hypothetical protein